MYVSSTLVDCRKHRNINEKNIICCYKNNIYKIMLNDDDDGDDDDGAYSQTKKNTKFQLATVKTSRKNVSHLRNVYLRSLPFCTRSFLCEKNTHSRAK